MRSTQRQIDTPEAQLGALRAEAAHVEEAILGAGLLYPDCLSDIVRLDPEDFTRGPRRALFEALRRLWAAGDPLVRGAVEAGAFDLVQLADRLRPELEGTLKAAGREPLVAAWLADLQGKAAVPAQLPGLIDRLRDIRRREVLHQRLIEAAETALRDPEDALTNVVVQLRLQRKLPEGEEEVIGPPVPPFSEEALRGLIGDLVEAHAEVTEAPLPLLWSAFITALGAAVGDRVALDAATRTPARLFTILVGPSGLSRKSTAIRLACKFFEETLGEDRFHVVRGLGSAEGLARLAEENQLSSILIALDELKALVNKSKVDGSTLLSLINQLFEEDYAENHTKNKSIEVRNLHLSLIAGCTDETFNRLFSREFLDIGFVNRLFLAAGRPTRRRAAPGKLDAETLRPLRRRLLQLVNVDLADYTPKDPLYIGFTEEALRIWDEFYQSLPRTVQAVRVDAVTLRAGLLLAVAEGEDRIGADLARAMVQLGRWQLAVREALWPSEAEGRVARMEEAIRRALVRRGPLRDRDLKRAVSAHRAGLWVYRTALHNLREAGEVAYDPVTKTYVAAEDPGTVTVGALDSDPAPDPDPGGDPAAETCRRFCRQSTSDTGSRLGQGQNPASPNCRIRGYGRLKRGGGTCRRR